jgi:hypothetical protein
VDITTDWFWEGNVVNVVARNLVGRGWRIDGQANTYSREQGVDLLASKAGAVLLIEAKGYPSTSYRDPNRANEQKRTNPTSQAEKWYSHALLKVLRLQTVHPQAKVALAFPDFPRYQSLFAETKVGLAKLGLSVLIVTESGQLSAWGLD